jgi:hypothetical protein
MTAGVWQINTGTQSGIENGLPFFNIDSLSKRFYG